MKTYPILTLIFYSNRVDFLLVGIVAAVWTYSGVTNPTRCQCQSRNCQQSNTSGNKAETLQHPLKAFADHFWSEGCIKCCKGYRDVVEIWETGDVLNLSWCKFEKLKPEKHMPSTIMEKGLRRMLSQLCLLETNRLKLRFVRIA